MNLKQVNKIFQPIMDCDNSGYRKSDIKLMDY